MLPGSDAVAVGDVPHSSHQEHSPPSHHGDDEDVDGGACQQASACATSMLYSSVTRDGPSETASERVTSLAALVPSSQFPDLEPPPPKA
jgi:hypothetical protein